MIAEALTISLVVLFLHATTWDGMIFEDIKKVIKPEGMLYKPIYGCPICMTPWYGTIFYFLFYNFTLVDYVSSVLGAAGFAVLWVVALTVRDMALTVSEKFEE